MMKRAMICVALLGMVLATSVQADCGECDFKPLLNGKNLDGWMNSNGDAPGAGWVIEDGAVVRKGAGGNLWTKARYGDFIVKMEFKTDSNSGVLLRCDNPKNYVQTCLEIQVLPPVAEPNKHSCGAMYDALAASKEMCKKGEWNTYVITMKGGKITIVLNDEKIIDADLDQWTEGNKNPDGSRNKFNTALKDFKREGHFGVQDHGGTVAYRNIMIKELK